MRGIPKRLLSYNKSVLLVLTLSVLTLLASAATSVSAVQYTVGSDSTSFNKLRFGLGVSFYDFVQGQVTMVGKYRRHELNLGMTISPRMDFHVVLVESPCGQVDCPVLYYSYSLDLDGPYSIAGGSAMYYLQLSRKPKWTHHLSVFVEYSEYHKIIETNYFKQSQYKERFQVMLGYSAQKSFNRNAAVSFSILAGTRYFFDRVIFDLFDNTSMPDLLSLSSVQLPRFILKLDFKYCLAND